LIDGLKFDLRLYVLLGGCDPLRIFLYTEGLVRFATELYEPPSNSNIDEMCMHLTNYAINKENEKFIFNTNTEEMNVGHKRSLSSVFEMLK
jgi:tubulin polyglutamylase TTLL6/13